MAGRYQNKVFEAKYKELAAMALAKKMERSPTGAPRLYRAEIVYLAAQTRELLSERKDFAGKVRKEFYSTRTCIALDGSGDISIYLTLKSYRGRERVAEWREKYLVDMAPGEIAQPRGVFELMQLCENPRMSDRDATLEELLDACVAEDDLAQMKEPKEPRGRGRGSLEDGPVSPKDAQELVSRERYAVPHGRRRMAPGDAAMQDKGRQDADERGEKRAKISELGIELMKELPRVGGSGGAKRNFSLEMAEYL